MTPNTRGALLMMGSMAAFTLNDTCIKLALGQLPLLQILTIRGGLTLVLLYLLARRLGSLRSDLSAQDWGLVALRAACETGATYFFITALAQMPLANVTAVIQMLPLTVTLGAALFLRESVGWRRYLAIALGFCGMLLIVRPGPEGFSTASIYALVAVAFVTVRDLSTRRMSARVPSMTVTLASALSVFVFAAAMSTGTNWEPLTPALVGLLGAASVFIMGGYLCAVTVMRVGEIGFIAPFRYTSLLWALVLGFLVFDHWPDGLTLLGAAVVVAAGLFTLYRERAGQAVEKT